MWHLRASKIPLSLSFLTWIKNEMIFLSYLWIIFGNIISEVAKKPTNSIQSP